MANTTPFALTAEITTLVSQAFDTGNVLLLAAVDRDRKPVLSFRGSTSVFSETQLSFWARNAGGERASDPERKGRAVIVDLDEVKGVLGFGKEGPIFCHLSRN